MLSLHTCETEMSEMKKSSPHTRVIFFILFEMKSQNSITPDQENDTYYRKTQVLK